MPATPTILETTVRGGIEPSKMLVSKLAGLRRRYVGVAMAAGVALMIVVNVELLALAMFVDWWIEIPWFFRCVLLLAHCAVFALIVGRFVILPFLRQPDDDDLALLVERSRPEFQTRLIAAVQFGQPGALAEGASNVLAAATVEQAEAMATRVDFNSLVDRRRMRKLAGAAGVVLLLAVGLLGVGGGTTFDLLKRVFLSPTPVPRKTRVMVAEGHRVIGRGDDVRLEAKAAGIVPARGTVEVRGANRRTRTYSMEADREDRTRFVRTLQNVQESFNYVVHLNDGRSEAFYVRVLPRPTVATIECLQEFPAYTKLPAARRPLGDLSLLAGSRLRVQITATKPIRSAAIQLVGTNLDSTLPLTVDSRQPIQLIGELAIPAQGLAGFSIAMTDLEGMSSKDSAVYRVEIVPDKVPAVKLTYPDRKEELLTREARMIVGMDMFDDFALSKVTLRYKVDTLEDGAVKGLPLDLQEEQPQRLRRQFLWNIGGFNPPLAEGSVIEYWIEAIDNNDVTGPGTGSSEHHIARVVSASEKRADLLNRAGDAFSSITDAAADQEQLNKRLGAIILEKTGPR